MTALELLKRMKEVYNNDSANRCIYGAEIISDGMLDGEFKMIRLAERLIDKELEVMAELAEVMADEDNI